MPPWMCRKVSRSAGLVPATQGAVEFPEPPAYVVPEDHAVRGLGCRDPGRRLPSWADRGPDPRRRQAWRSPRRHQRPRVVQLHEEADARPVRETGQEPHLPQGSAEAVQAASAGGSSRRSGAVRRFVTGEGGPGKIPTWWAMSEGGGVHPQKASRLLRTRASE